MAFSAHLGHLNLKMRKACTNILSFKFPLLYPQKTGPKCLAITSVFAFFKDKGRVEMTICCNLHYATNAIS